MRSFVLDGFSPERLVHEKARVAQLYHEYGVVIFPSFFVADKAFSRFKHDLSWGLDEVIAKYSEVTPPADLGDKLSMLAKFNIADGKVITDLGTQPNKFNSFNLIKYSSWIDALLTEIFPKDAVLATPQAGDTLHFFPPGEEFHRYNLPPHQDYHYLMQSPEQITFYAALSEYRDQVGGLKVWEKSHQLGILDASKNRFGAFEIFNSSDVLKDLEVFNYEWNVGDFAIFNSLLAHSSIPNISPEYSRIVQIFRFSNLNNQIARQYDFRSTSYPRRSALFTDYHPEHYIEPS